MNANSQVHDNEDKPILTVIQQLKDGTRNPKSLTREERQQCIEACTLEGYTVHQIAQLLQCSEKTVRRDLAAIRERNAMTPNVEFVKQLVGDVYQKITSHHDYLVRVAKIKETGAAEKIVAISAACKALTDLFKLLQSVGYVPLSPQKITGDIYHHQAEEENKSLVELKNELDVFERTAAETGVLDDAVRLQMKLIEKKIEEAQIVQQLLEVKHTNSLNVDVETNKMEGSNE